MPGCCVPGCGSRDKTHMSFHTLPPNEKLSKLWLENVRNSKLSDQIYMTLHRMQVCHVHFRDIQYRTANKQKLNTGAYPVLFLPVIKDVDVREFVKGAVPPIFDNDTISNSNESSKPVESNENDLETISDKIVAEPDVRPSPILFVSTSADYEEEEEVLTTINKQLHTYCDPLKKRIVQNSRYSEQRKVEDLESPTKREGNWNLDYKEEEEEEEVLTSSNKQPDSDCDVLNKRIVQNPRYSEQCKVENLESPIKTERNWNQVLNKNSALQKKVNILQNRNRRLAKRVKSMKTLLRLCKNTHAG